VPKARSAERLGYWQIPRRPQEHFPAEVQHGLPMTHFAHDEALQLPPPEELVLGVEHAPTLQTWLDIVQFVHSCPPVPHTASVEPPWHMLFMSQHPWQVEPEHPPPVVPLDPPDPPPASSPPLLLVLLPLPLLLGAVA